MRKRVRVICEGPLLLSDFHCSSVARNDCTMLPAGMSLGSRLVFQLPMAPVQPLWTWSCYQHAITYAWNKRRSYQTVGDERFFPGCCALILLSSRSESSASVCGKLSGVAPSLWPCGNRTASWSHVTNQLPSDGGLPTECERRLTSCQLVSPLKCSAMEQQLLSWQLISSSVIWLLQALCPENLPRKAGLCRQ